MHDIDRTQLEAQETGYEAAQFEFPVQGEIAGESLMESPVKRNSITSSES